jgi:uncharacterized protein (TIGR00255 family)
MTGFARATGQGGAYAWTWEVKSVNGRGLDVRCRLPNGFEALEPAARAAVTKRFRRGSVSLQLQLSRAEGAAAVRLNRELLDWASALAKELEREAGLAPASADGLLALRGVIEPAEPEETDEARETRTAAMLADLGSALDGLAAARRSEGDRLSDVVATQLNDITALIGAAEASAAAQPDAIRARLRENIDALLEASPALPEERLAQEAALLITKADVREELDRLRAHVAAVGEILVEGEGGGRRLDFLAQELNREANTLCAKSADAELTRIGLDLKVLIDQFREQVQNIE